MAHSTPEQLIAFLDGELDPAEYARVQEHLHRCWKCRGNLAGLERAMTRLAAGIHNPDWPTGDQQEHSRRWLMARLARESAAHSRAPVLLLPRTSGTLPRWMLAAAAVVVGLVGLSWLRGPVSMSEGLFIAAAPVSSPAGAERTVLMQRFAAWEQAETHRRHQTGAWRGSQRIRIARQGAAAPQQVQVVESLHLETDHSRQWRMRTPQGGLRLAAWQPGPDPRLAYQYSERRWGRVTRMEGSGFRFPHYAAASDTAAEEDLSASVFQWIQHMVLDSHLPTRRFANLAALPGSETGLFRKDGATWVCVSWTSEGSRMADCLEADVRHGEVLRERMLITGTGAGAEAYSLEILIDWLPAEPVPVSAVYAGEFLPAGLRALDLRRGIIRPQGDPDAPAPLDRRAELLTASLEVEEALLLLNLMNGAEFDLDLHLAAESVIIRGRVQTMEQFEAVQQSILPVVENPGLLEFDVLVASLAPLPPAAERPADNPPQAGDPPAARALQTLSPDMPGARIRELCNRVVRLSGETVAGARRLESLRQRYRTADLARLSEEDRHRLAAIRARYQRHLRQTSLQLEEVLASLVPDLSPAFAPSGPRPTYEQYQQMHNLLLGFFALGHPGPGPAAEELPAAAQRVRAFLAAGLEERHSAASPSVWP
jgi:anti-sigma factor RsiW